MHKFPTPNKVRVTVADHFGNKQTIDKFDAWMKAVKLQTKLKFDCVCSKHFTDTDYRALAIPTVNLPNSNVSSEVMEVMKKREKRLQSRNNTKLKEKSNDNSRTVEKARFEEVKKKCDELLEHQDEQVHYVYFQPEVSMVKEVYEADICATSDDSECKFMSLLTTEKKLSTGTGIENFNILNTIIKSYSEIVGDRFEGQKTVMKTRDRVLLTLCMLKQNSNYSFLALIFDTVSEQRCQRIITETLVVLSKILKLAIRWPSNDEIRKNIPLAFENYPETRIVLDCTEIFIQNPKNLCCQIITYSHCKGDNTLKFMTGVTPAGDISYISSVYGGRVSDSKIFGQSELMSLLEPGDCIMVDRGFLIEEICEKNQWKCLKPPYLKGQKQFSSANAIYSHGVAKARVHVKRSNQRIKNFAVLGGVMPSCLVPFAEDIMTVVCGIVNLSSPIMSDDKFFESSVQE
ncbi:hypothetical protein TKK_0011539 [Trichogramma kaykai]|uniref:DDE Tnp4 domain-containing protein n=1 Tax=Trichogramma kaykai TaxID=54128 RepID=A0ABD2WRP2_9HYME